MNFVYYVAMVFLLELAQLLLDLAGLLISAGDKCTQASEALVEFVERHGGAYL